MHGTVTDRVLRMHGVLRFNPLAGMDVIQRSRRVLDDTKHRVKELIKTSDGQLHLSGMRQKFLILAVMAIPLYSQDFHRLAFNVGGGPTFGVSDTSDRINTGYNFTVGGGYNFGKYIGLNLDYIYNGADLSTNVLNLTRAPGGYARAWGFGLNPIVQIAPDRRLGGYVTAGYGVYTRTVNLTRPGIVPGTICDPWTWICYSGPVYADLIYRSNSTTKGGWDIGGGLTYKFAGSMKFYAEVRYYEIMTTNVRTQLLPLTFGLRW